MELGPRDRLSQAFMKELEKVARSRLHTATSCTLIFVIWAERSSTRRSRSCASCARMPRTSIPVKDLIPVRPVVHYMMGGVHTDINGATPLAGLYAAGEVACVSIIGANRLGSNSLPELLVFGARAGKRRPSTPRVMRLSRTSCRAGARRATAARARHPREDRRSGNLADIRDQMQKTLEESAGIYRDGAKLAWAVGRLRELQDRVTDVAIEDHSRTFNTERVAALELACMLDVAEAIGSRRSAAKNRAAPISGRIFRRATTAGFWRTR